MQQQQQLQNANRVAQSSINHIVDNNNNNSWEIDSLQFLFVFYAAFQPRPEFKVHGDIGGSDIRTI